MLLEKDCPWQALMNGPYERWQDHNKEDRRALSAEEIDEATYRLRRWSFKDMLINTCSTPERVACILGKLNQQVENGGFSQWIDNRYAIESVDWFPEILSKMGPVSERVRAMCAEMMEWVDEDTGVLAEDYYNSAGPEGVSDRLSTEFYTLEDEWHKEVYAYLEKL